MLKSIIAAVFMTTAFTIVTVGVVSVTGEQALAAKNIPVSAERASKLASDCLLSGGESIVPEEDIPGNTLTLGCCATNSEGVKWCVACNGGTKARPTDCTVVTARVPGRLTPKPGQDQLAPTKKKPRFPGKMSTGTLSTGTMAPATTKPAPAGTAKVPAMKMQIMKKGTKVVE